MKTDPLLIETIRISRGRVKNIKYHNARCNHARKVLFGKTKPINLRTQIKSALPEHDEVKCRISYDGQVRKVEYEPYTLRQIKFLKAIEVGDYNYTFKYKDREKLRFYFEQRGEADDVLLLKNGYLTDTSYANVALQKEGRWYTPKQPLLHGTARARLIGKKLIQEKDIHIRHIDQYDKMTIFNAMLPFGKMFIEISNVDCSQVMA